MCIGMSATFLLFTENIIYWVLSTFKESLFTWSQTFISSSSELIFCVSTWGSFPEKNKFVSSAYSIGKDDFILEAKSFIYNKKRIGPRIDPCGTPHVMEFDLQLLYVTNCVLLQR